MVNEYVFTLHVNKLVVLVPCEEINVGVKRDSTYDGVSTAILPGLQLITVSCFSYTRSHGEACRWGV